MLLLRGQFHPRVLMWNLFLNVDIILAHKSVKKILRLTIRCYLLSASDVCPSIASMSVDTRFYICQNYFRGVTAMQLCMVIQ